MAFGSAVVRTKTRTATNTSTRSSGSTKTKGKPRASTSRTVGAMAKLVPSSSSGGSSDSDEGRGPPKRRTGDSDDSDFGQDMQEQAHREARAMADKEAALRLRQSRKLYLDRGQPVPAELKIKRKKSSGLPVQARERDDKDDVLAVVQADRRSKEVKGRGRARDSSDSDVGQIKATEATFRRGAKRKEVMAMHGVAIAGAGVSDEEGADDVLDAVRETGGDLSDDVEEVKKHLARRWVNKKNPNAMTARRKQLELKYNPLIRMLDVEIQVVSGPTRGAGSDEERRHADTHIVNLTDSEGPDTDWNTSGAENAVVFRPKRRLSPRPRVKTESPSPQKAPKVELDEMEDVKPQIAPRKLFLPPAPSPEDVKPVIVLSDDDEEPTTADEGPATRAPAPHALTPLDVKPVVFFSTRALSASSATALTPVASTSAVPMVDDGPAEEEDSGAEPDTEASDVEVAPPPATAMPHFPAHTHSSQLLGGVKSEQASQMSLPSSRGSLQRVKVEVDVDEDEGSEVEIVEDAMLRGVRAAAEEKKAREQARRAEESRRKVQAEIAAKRRLKEEEEEKTMREQDEHEDGDDEDGDEEDAPLMWDVGKGSHTSTWPQPVRKGRPKFLLENAQQATMGAHHLSKDKTDKAQIPAPINRFLRQYQREGAEFLYAQYKEGLGGILGDDMGLGKTIQVIAFLSAVMNKQGLKNFDAGKRKEAINERAADDPIDLPSDLGPTCLIVCPTTVVRNWEREFQTWGYFDVGVFAGPKKADKMNVLRRFDLGYLDVVVAGIEGVRDYIAEFKARDFTIVVVDEAHRLKNRKSNTTRAMHEFGTRLRYGLTGTAMQNQLGEFWCVLNWAVPGRVGTHQQWKDLVSRPLKYAQAADADDAALALGRKRAFALVSTLLPHFWLRRTKDVVQLQLPPKTDNVVLCPLTPLQQRVYRRLLELEDVQIMLTADDPCPCGARDSEDKPYRRGSCCEQEWTKMIFKYISLFQGVSNHLALMYPNREDKRKEPLRYEQAVNWMKVAFPNDWQERKPGPQAALDPDLCGKWKILCELLDLWHREGHKVLIFSMSLKILDLLSALMETTRYKYLTLDGSTPQEDRMPLVDEFNDPAGDVFCFLISTRAGGVGLNLTAANRVVIFDPNWNPSHDLQAMDRAYRFGQTRKVDVYRLIGAGTLEELIYNRQQYKRAMATTSYDATAVSRQYTGVQGEGKSQHGDLWGVKNIFTLSDKISLTEKSIERANLAELEYAMRNPGLFETVDGKVADLAEPDAEEVVAEVTGYSKKAEATNHMTPEERARHERALHEQETIKRILSGVKTTESDTVIGGSKIEMLRGNAAIQGEAAQAKAVVAPKPHAPAPAAKKGAKKRSKTETAPEDVEAWDAVKMRRQSGAASSQPAQKKVKLEAKDPLEHAGLPEDVSIAEAIKLVGYGGADGRKRFYGEFNAADKATQGNMVRRLTKAWREENGE